MVLEQKSVLQRVMMRGESTLCRRRPSQCSGLIIPDKTGTIQRMAQICGHLSGDWGSYSPYDNKPEGTTCVGQGSSASRSTRCNGGLRTTHPRLRALFRYSVTVRGGSPPSVPSSIQPRSASPSRSNWRLLQLWAASSKHPTGQCLRAAPDRLTECSKGTDFQTRSTTRQTPIAVPRLNETLRLRSERVHVWLHRE